MYTKMNGYTSIYFPKILQFTAFVTSNLPPMSLSNKKERLCCKVNRPRGHKLFFMLDSVEHEILNAHKYMNIKKFGFLGSDKPRMPFSRS